MSIVPDTAETVVRASHVPGPPQGSWTYEDYARLPLDAGFVYEIIDGVLYMAPAPPPEHERLVISFGARLYAIFEEGELGRVYSSPDIVVGSLTLRPDLAVVRNANLAVVAPQRLIGPPDLVVEIASPSTAVFDRDSTQGKRAAYARIGVGEYWLVEPSTRTIEVLVLTDAAYRSLGIFSGEEPLRSHILSGNISLAARFFPHGASYTKSDSR